MKQDERKQIILRAPPETVQMIDDIRRVMEPIPTVTDVLLLAIESLHKDLVKPTRKRAS